MDVGSLADTAVSTRDGADRNVGSAVHEVMSGPGRSRPETLT